MIKATMTCTNCKRDRDIPSDELHHAVMLDREGELNLCTACEKMWVTTITILNKERDTAFAEYQEQFGMGRDKEIE